MSETPVARKQRDIFNTPNSFSLFSPHEGFNIRLSTTTKPKPPPANSMKSASSMLNRLSLTESEATNLHAINNTPKIDGKNNVSEDANKENNYRTETPVKAIKQHAGSTAPSISTTTAGSRSNNEIKEKKKQFNQFVVAAKNHEVNESFREALQMYVNASKLFVTEKLEKKIRRLQRVVQELEEQEQQQQQQQQQEEEEDNRGDDDDAEYQKQYENCDDEEEEEEYVFEDERKKNMKHLNKAATTTTKKRSSTILRGSGTTSTGDRTTRNSNRGSNVVRDDDKEVEDDEAEEEEEEDDDDEQESFTDMGDGFKRNNKTKKYHLTLTPTVDEDEDRPSRAKKQPEPQTLILTASIYESLYPYQREGVKWMWERYIDGEGGIMGDDMGLGKTIQMVSFVAGLFESRAAKFVLIVMPLSVLENWKNEFAKWAPEVDVSVFHGMNARQRDAYLREMRKRGGVCLTTYGMITSQIDSLVGSKIVWDHVLLDEGHKIKNPNIAISKALRRLPSKHRTILTGTPIQNNLHEMWALYDYIFEGQLLGSSRDFKVEFENKIVRASEKDATLFEKRLGEEIAQQLRDLIKPYFLRREKKQVLAQIAGASSENEDNIVDEECTEVGAESVISQKNDLIVWTHLTPSQIKLYQDFLSSKDVQLVLNKKISAFASITWLKNICTHPLLCDHERFSEFMSDDDADISQMIAESGKMIFIEKLLDELKRTQHRPLIFSQSTRLLDLIQRMITSKGYKFLRVDGEISKPEERQKKINLFNAKGSPYFCFLLTTQTGGVGITLTGADRVIIADPAWNPATDNQAVDRAYRIGQTRNVIVYRLIACGTIEEKIYRKQVFKEALSKMATEKHKKSHLRYFTAQELRQLFTLDDPSQSETQQQLQQIHPESQRKSYPELDEHIKVLRTLGIFGVSDHDLLFNKLEQTSPTEQDQLAKEQAQQASLRLLSTRQQMVYDNNNNNNAAQRGLTPPDEPIAPVQLATMLRNIKSTADFQQQVHQYRQEQQQKYQQQQHQQQPPASEPIDLTAPYTANLPVPAIAAVAPSSSKDVGAKSFRRARFSDEEVKNLIKGVRKFGEGKWANILKAYKFESSRTPASLSSKWRNIKKSNPELIAETVDDEDDDDNASGKRSLGTSPQDAIAIDDSDYNFEQDNDNDNNNNSVPSPPQQQGTINLDWEEDEFDDDHVEIIKRRPARVSSNRKSLIAFSQQIVRRLSMMFEQDINNNNNEDAGNNEHSNGYVDENDAEEEPPQSRSQFIDDECEDDGREAYDEDDHYENDGDYEHEGDEEHGEYEEEEEYDFTHQPQPKQERASQQYYIDAYEPEEEEQPVVIMKKSKSRRNNVIDSDSEEEDVKPSMLALQQQQQQRRSSLRTSAKIVLSPITATGTPTMMAATTTHGQSHPLILLSDTEEEGEEEDKQELEQQESVNSNAQLQTTTTTTNVLPQMQPTEYQQQQQQQQQHQQHYADNYNDDVDDCEMADITDGIANIASPIQHQQHRRQSHFPQEQHQKPLAMSPAFASGALATMPTAEAAAEAAEEAEEEEDLDQSMASFVDTSYISVDQQQQQQQQQAAPSPLFDDQEEQEEDQRLVGDDDADYDQVEQAEEEEEESGVQVVEEEEEDAEDCDAEYNKKAVAYNTALANAKEAEARSDLYAALDLYLDALDINDDDVKLHYKIVRLAKQLNMYT